MSSQPSWIQIDGKQKPMTKRKKNLQLEDIPILLEKAVNLMDQEISYLFTKEKLSCEDRRDLIAMVTACGTMYRDYRQEVLQIEKDLKSKSKEEILSIIKEDGKKR